MKESELSNNNLSLMGVSVAGAVSVATTSGSFDLTDTAVGIILFLMLWPLLFAAKSVYLKVLISTSSGMCLLLTLGVLVEIFQPYIYPESKHQVLHFTFWVLASILSLIFVTVVEKKQNNANSAVSSKEK